MGMDMIGFEAVKEGVTTLKKRKGMAVKSSVALATGMEK